MKRHNNLFEKIVDMDNLRQAYADVRRHKTRRSDVIKFDTQVESNLKAIRDMLITKSYVPSKYRSKTVYEPKKREIYLLPLYPDKVIHHAVMNIVAPIWENLFIADTYACLPDRGLHEGSYRTSEFVQRNTYCLKCDVSKLYASVDHDILYEIVQRKIKCKDTLHVLKTIIYSFPGGKNIPIGNYTSQWLGNLYLNELDMMVKHQLKVKHYVRYCDDFLLFSDDKAFLNTCLQHIIEFLETRLLLRLSKQDLFPVSRGVDFLGYRHFRGYKLLRKSTAKKIKRRIRSMARLHEVGRLHNYDKALSVLGSYYGWAQHANSHNFLVATRLQDLRHEFYGEKIFRP